MPLPVDASRRAQPCPAAPGGPVHFIAGVFVHSAALGSSSCSTIPSLPGFTAIMTPSAMAPRRASCGVAPISVSVRRRPAVLHHLPTDLQSLSRRPPLPDGGGAVTGSLRGLNPSQSVPVSGTPDVTTHSSAAAAAGWWCPLRSCVFVCAVGCSTLCPADGEGGTPSAAAAATAAAAAAAARTMLAQVHCSPVFQSPTNPFWYECVCVCV